MEHGTHVVGRKWGTVQRSQRIRNQEIRKKETNGAPGGCCIFVGRGSKGGEKGGGTKVTVIAHILIAMSE